MDAEKKPELLKAIIKPGNLYSFLSQIIPYQDSDLERLYVFLRHLATKLPRRAAGPSYQFDDEVRLEYYRLQKISEGSISLSDGQANRLDGPSEVGTGTLREEALLLSRLIDVVNDRFGTDFNQADQLFFDQIVEVAISDAALRQAAAVNPGDKFELVFKNLLEALFIERMDQNEEIFARFMNDRSFQKLITSSLSSEAYRKLRLPSQLTSDDTAMLPPFMNEGFSPTRKWRGSCRRRTMMAGAIAYPMDQPAGMNPQDNLTLDSLNVGISTGENLSRSHVLSLDWRPDTDVQFFLRATSAVTRTAQNSTHSQLVGGNLSWINDGTGV